MCKIMFVCHGNICRSPMAEFVLKNMVEKIGLKDKFLIVSSATSKEETGSPVHEGTVAKLLEYGISTEGKYAIQLKNTDYEKYDYFLGMDNANIKNMKNILGADPDKKIYKLLHFANRQDDIADPWYTRNFDATYDDIIAGCKGFLKYIKNKNL